MPKKRTNQVEIYQKLAEEDITVVEAGWRPFTISIVKDLHSGGSKVWGSTDFDRCVISLEEDIDNDTAKETLLHEITHVILSTVGFGGYDREDFGEEFPDGYVEATNNEYMALQVSRGFLLMMRLNPELFKILLGE